ncbi:hypothetical protein AVV02_gp001 [Bacillus phage AvesoBmore]|nr:hypothetical protein AVV02_gp001 [Bacillus phage AvesoBmore]ALA13466.1 hypothetical protein AVESOBMORE_1 [Bacillus phage AvesoBmore]
MHEDKSLDNLIEVLQENDDIPEVMIHAHARRFYGSVNDDTIASVWDDIYIVLEARGH